MPRLRRLFYDNIGHPEARFRHLEVPFCHGDGPPEDSVVLLKNGGGKSALLSLLFTVLQPRLRAFLGQRAEEKQPRSLRDYVLRDDHGVIVLEWELDADASGTPGGRLLTGVFLERELRAPDAAEPAPEDDDGAGGVSRLFFSYFVRDDAPATALEALPLHPTADRTSRYAMQGFKSRLTDLGEQAPHAQVFMTSHQGDWLDLLDSRGLDAELFLYQIRMNQREGGAKDLFKACGTVEDYLDLFLEVLMDRSFGANIRSNLAAHREVLLDRRVRLLPSLALLKGVVAALTPLQPIARDRAELLVRGRSVAARFLAYTQYATRRMAERDAEITACRKLEADAEREVNELAALALTHQREAARLGRDLAIVAHRDAAARAQRIQEEWNEAGRLEAGWTAAALLRDARQSEAEAASLRAEITAREARHAPLLDDLRATATRYLAAVRAALALADERQQEAVAAQEAADAAREDAEARRRAAEAERARQDTLALSHDISDASIQGDLAELVRGDVLVSLDEPLPAAGLRLLCAVESARGIVHDAERALERAKAAADEAVREHRSADRELHRADAARLQEQRILETAMDRALRIGALPLLSDTLEVTTVDATRLGSDAVARLRDRARAANERALVARARLAALRRASDALEHSGLLPATTDAEAVVRALADGGVTGHTGWAYLAGAMRSDEARALAERAPDVAMGVVVQDGAFDEAVRIVHRAPVEIEYPVRITRQSAVRDTEGADGHVALPATEALYDRRAGAAALPGVTTRVAAADRDADEAEQERDEAATTAASLADFLREFGATWFAEQRVRVTQATEAHRIATERLTAATAEAARCQAAVETLTTVRRGAEQEVQRLLLVEKDLAEFRRRHGDDPAVHAQAAAAARAQARAAQQVAIDAIGDVERAKEAGVVARSVAERIGQDRVLLQQEAAGISWADDTVVSAAGDRRSLARTYRQSKDVYEQKIDSEGLIRLAARADEDTATNRRKLHDQLASGRHGWTEATVAALLADLPDPAEAEHHAGTHAAKKDRLFGQRGQASQTVTLRQGELDRALDACAAAGMPSTEADVTRRREELPADAGEQTAAWREEREQHLTRAVTAETSAENARSLMDEATRTIEAATAGRGALCTSLDMLTNVHAQAPALLDALEGIEDEVEAWMPTSDEQFARGLSPWIAERKVYLTETDTLDTRRDEEVRHLHLLLSEPEHSAIIDPSLNRLRLAKSPVLEAHVEELLAELDVRILETTAQIAAVDKHRDQLVAITLTAAEDGRRMIRRMGTQSVIPAGVRTFGGHPVLRLRGHDAQDATADRAAVEALVDRLTSADRLAPIPPGLQLVQQAVRAIMPKLAMDVIYPKPEREIQYWAITKLGKMSGGEGLTVATLLYCALARLRTQGRGAAGRVSSVLLFDNPFGIASAASFVTLQRDFARAHNVQLVYFTGVLDLEAIQLLPNRVRLGSERFDAAARHQLVERADDDQLVAAIAAATGAGDGSLVPVQVLVDAVPYLQPPALRPDGAEPPHADQPAASQSLGNGRHPAAATF